MALPKLYDRVYWDNNTTPAINKDNLNSLSKAVDDIDDRVISLAGTIMEDVPQIQEDIEELEEDFALIDEKIADATSEANRATTKANEAAASVISAGNKALISEGYAKGTQNGTPVGSSSPYYHNNAEYFKEQARSFTPEGYQDLVDDVAEAQEAITDIEGEKVSSNDAYVLRQCKGNSVDLGLVGGSVAWNQLIKNGNFASTSNWTAVYSNFSVSNNVATITATSQWGRIQTDYYSILANHVYLAIATIKGTTDNYLSIGNIGSVYCTSTSEQTLAKMVKPSAASSESLAIGDRRSSGWTSFTAKNVMLFDLTQLFGSTMADYIYSLEQATAGAGVAWFRKYFRNLYYGYDPGSIQSVNPSYRKVTGKNLFEAKTPTTVQNGITATSQGDGSYIFSGTASALSDFYFRPISQYQDISAGTYKMNGISGGSNSTYRLYLVQYNKTTGETTYVGTNDGDSSAIVIGENVAVNLFLRVYNNATLNNIIIKPMLRLASDPDSTYEPYRTPISYLFDTSIQLRGIPKLVDNKLSYDGDIYTADGTVTRNYGIVDLGTLTWAVDNTSLYYITSVLTPNAKIVVSTESAKAICSKYQVLSHKSVDTNHNYGISIGPDGRIRIWDDVGTYADAAAFKTAMSGVYLVYELATPTTESANAYQNPQRAFTDGIEEFIDAGVTASTRDVSIPVGNESEYNTSVVLPISQDYTDGAMEILKEIVASSSDFADFKTKVAAL